VLHLQRDSNSRWVCTAVLTSKVAVSWLWSGAGEVLAELLAHSAIIYSVAATADGRIASGEVRCLDMLLQRSVQPIVGMLLGHSAIIYSVAATADGRIAVHSGECICYHSAVRHRLRACCRATAFACSALATAAGSFVWWLFVGCG
jgi:hypothetical protein